MRGVSRDFSVSASEDSAGHFERTSSIVSRFGRCEPCADTRCARRLERRPVRASVSDGGPPVGPRSSLIEKLSGLY